MTGNMNSNASGSPVLWTREEVEEDLPLDAAVAAILAVPKSEADAEEAKRPKRERAKP